MWEMGTTGGNEDRNGKAKVRSNRNKSWWGENIFNCAKYILLIDVMQRTTIICGKRHGLK